MHREAEFSGSLQHPSPSEMPLKTSSRHNPFSLMALHRLSLCCGPWSGFCCCTLMLEEGVQRGRSGRVGTITMCSWCCQAGARGAVSPVVALGTSVSVV